MDFSIKLEQPPEGKCECGIVFQGISNNQLLKEIIDNSLDDQVPCDKCVDKLRHTDSKKNLNCFICDVSLGAETYLHKHLLMHHIPSTPYKCEFCPKKFKMISLLGLHIIEHTPMISKKSDVDVKRPSTKVAQRRSNRRTKTESATKLQGVLSEEYYTQYRSYIDILDNQSNNSYLCNLCGRNYASRNGYWRHTQLHKADGKKKFTCLVCQKEYLTKTRLTNHIRYAHKGRKPVYTVKGECGICHHKVSKYALNAHIKRQHGTPSERESLKKKECKYCAARFQTENALNDHVNSNHTGDKPHVCETCGKAFGSNLAFKRHLLIHTGEKKYKCDTCGVSFNQKCTLTRHQVVHTGEKPFECGICGQRFTQKPYMKAHEKKCKDGKTVTVKRKKKKYDSSEESDETSEENYQTSEDESESFEESEELSDED